jgi:hypothetical protein
VSEEKKRIVDDNNYYNYNSTKKRINYRLPVLAPDGTAARKTPLSVITSTSTVGFPRLS